MRLPKRMMPHGGLVQVEAFVGHGGKGAVFADPVVPERACIQDEERLIRGAASENVSNATVWLDPEDYVPTGSRVTVWLGGPQEYTTTVRRALNHEHGPGLPAHVELILV